MKIYLFNGVLDNTHMSLIIKTTILTATHIISKNTFLTDYPN